MRAIAARVGVGWGWGPHTDKQPATKGAGSTESVGGAGYRMDRRGVSGRTGWGEAEWQQGRHAPERGTGGCPPGVSTAGLHPR